MSVSIIKNKDSDFFYQIWPDAPRLVSIGSEVKPSCAWLQSQCSFTKTCCLKQPFRVRKQPVGYLSSYKPAGDRKKNGIWPLVISDGFVIMIQQKNVYFSTILFTNLLGVKKRVFNVGWMSV